MEVATLLLDGMLVCHRLLASILSGCLPASVKFGWLPRKAYVNQDEARPDTKHTASPLNSHASTP